ncbi:MAG: RsmB/NOP family class I SAM-dependent RNA methyltransferase [Bacteroidota bacterium]
MKLHYPILNSIITALHKIINENFYSDKVLEYIFKSNKKLGKRDRQIIAETVYNIVRYYYLYQYLAKSNEIEEIVKTFFHYKDEQLDTSSIPDRIKLSFNDDLWNEAIQQLGETKWIKEATALNQTAPLVIRANTLKISKQELQNKLLSVDIETYELPDVPEALVIANKKFLSQNEYFKSGYYEFQDASSQKVAHFIPKDILSRAKRIIDACAGAGGKTLHLSALMKNQGQIIAMDVEEKKLNELKKRATRAGCNNIQIKLIDSKKVIKRLENSADILLIDAPCSGTGVIKRNPDTKIKFTSQHLNELIILQKKILTEYNKMINPNGYLLYVTCSILPKENEDQIQFFLSENKNFEIIKHQTIFPSSGFDGFYMALLKKKA